jgi:hypothetical protein
MFVKKFNQFILEKQTDEKLVKKVKTEMQTEMGECPRCGRSFHDCMCSERDYYSTVNAYRTPPGKKLKSK